MCQNFLFCDVYVVLGSISSAFEHAPCTFAQAKCLKHKIVKSELFIAEPIEGTFSIAR